jgi:pimeloyl-ACP methyl ester carboxylesterase/class 3 adenylate cyclase
VSGETRYAKSGDINIAYQVVGEGPLDLVLVPGWVSHVEFAWTEPSFAAFLHRLASFSRLIILDRRGTGMSDRVASMPTLEQRMDDVRAVMDAAGSERAALFGISEGGPMCCLFAATYPERTRALILYGTIATGKRDASYPWGLTEEQVDQLLALIERDWGTGFSVQLFAPSIAGDPEQVKEWARFERMAASPGAARMLIQLLLQTDVREVLPTIRVPTLVLHRTDDQATLVGGGRYLAEHIPGARYVELPGQDHFAWVGDSAGIISEAEEFLTGSRQVADTERVLATVLFIDIVGSTEKAAALGDRRWRELLQRFYGAAREHIRMSRGIEVKTTGDGMFARFDGPARGIRCGRSILDAARGLGLDARAGLHTGECELIGADLGGIAVHLGARVADAARAGEVLVSSTVKDLVAGSGLEFLDRGLHELKGIPGKWQLYAAKS